MWKQVFLVVLLVLWAHVYADESHEALPVHASAEDAAAVHAAEKRESPVGRQRREGHGHGHDVPPKPAIGGGAPALDVEPAPEK